MKRTMKTLLGATMLALLGTGTMAADTTPTIATDVDTALENAQSLVTREMKRGGYLK